MNTSLSGSKRMTVWLLAMGLFFSAAIARADEEQDLVAILKSNVTPNQKCDACQKLRLVGTAKAVPGIAPLLTNEQTGQAARYALEGMTCPEATAALRKAAGKSSGLTKAGLIDSLGWKRDGDSVSLMKKSLSDKDPAVASASAAALGRIGNKKAADALVSARDNKDLQPVVLDALLRCAEQLRTDGEPKQAVAICNYLTNSKYPPHVRAAASRQLATIGSLR